MKKKLTTGILILFLIAVVSSVVVASEAMGTLVKLKQESDWAGGELAGVVINPDQSGTLVLEKVGENYQKQGTFISKEIEITPFNQLVPSWNAITPQGTYITVDVQFRVDGQWSEYLTLGEWGTFHVSKSASRSTDLGYTSTDTIMVSNGKAADAFRFKVGLYGDGVATPVVRLLTATTFNSNKLPEVTLPVPKEYLTELPVPKRSQMIEDDLVAGRICSPTSLSMVLEYYGINKTTKEIYDLVYDNGDEIYGNWPFNTAVAGSFGLEAYVDYYFSVDEIKQRIAEGIPVVCSIKFKAGQLIGAPISSTSGHLVVAIGFVIRDGQEYVICNDPAAATPEEARREYLVDQFARAWKGWVYIIKKQS